MARSIIRQTGLPELGTKEAALEGCVDLIARMCGKPETVVRYWLDLYFQTRLAYAVEEEQQRRKFDAKKVADAIRNLRQQFASADDGSPESEARAQSETTEEEKPVAERSVTPPPLPES